MAQLWLNDTLDLLTAPYLAEVGTQFGDWQAITTSVDSLFLDGSVVSGESTGNRTITLQVQVQDRWSRPALIGACEALLVEANKAAGTIRFVPDEGPSVVYTVYRAQPSRIDDQSEAWPRRTYELAFPAQPFTRSAERAMPAAFAPATTVEGFDSSPSGVFLGTPFSASISGVGNIYIAMPTAASGSVTVAAFSVNPANTGHVAMSPVSNCTGGGFPLTVTAQGDAEAVTASSWPLPTVDADFITAGLNLGPAANVAAQVAVEWLDDADTSLGVVWGLPRANTSGVKFAPWVVARPPIGATRLRIRLRLLDAPAGDCDVYEGGAAAAALSTVPVYAQAVHDGTGGLSAAMDADANTQPASARTGYVYGALPAPLDVSGKTYLSLWFEPRTVDADFSVGRDVLALRLFDVAGRWTRWQLSGQVAFGAWVRLGWDPTAGESSPEGPADLSQVSGWDLSLRNTAPWYVDTIAAGPAPTPSSSTYGTVFDLDVLGSARSPVQLTLSSGLAMSDWLVATAATDCPPMLAVSTATATVAAPAAYSGVYRVLASVVPAAAVATPTCTVTQYVDGVQVATETLDGTQTEGNAYVDFGTVPLPLVGVPADSQSVSYGFALTPSGAAWGDVLVLDVDQPLAWVPNLPTAQTYGWIDEPEATAQLGRVWVGSTTDRSDARSPSDPPDLSRPFSVRAPGVSLLVYSTAGAPDVSLSYYPHWLVEPTQ